LSTETKENYDKPSINSAVLRTIIRIPCKSANHSKRSVKHYVLHTQTRTATICKKMWTGIILRDTFTTESRKSKFLSLHWFNCP